MFLKTWDISNRSEKAVKRRYCLKLELKVYMAPKHYSTLLLNLYDPAVKENDFVGEYLQRKLLIKLSLFAIA
jgi:hypothetical protein